MSTAASIADPLAKYWAKRDFAITAEPRGEQAKPGKTLSFVIQKHAASRLHYDFRLELDGVLVSWAVPKGPSFDPSDILPNLKGRPCSLVRGPNGVAGQLFFQKHGEKIGIPGIKELDPALWPGHTALLEVATEQALVGCAQMNVIEFHTWNSIAKNIDKPDRMIFDLDPGEGTEWKHIQEAATLVRSLLGDLGLSSWLKTSGGKGLHVVVPLAPRLDYDTVKDFSQAAVKHLAKVVPSRFVAKSGPSNRIGKLFVDYLRNGHGATTAAAFSARARPGLGVSMPIAWDDLAQLKSGAQWTISTAREHLSFETSDPWTDYWSAKQTLTAAMKSLGFKKPAARR